jgi:hypothetical protein
MNMSVSSARYVLALAITQRAEENNPSHCSEVTPYLTFWLLNTVNRVLKNEALAPPQHGLS